MATRSTPKPGEFYRHFKNRLYQIVTIAYDSETTEPLVVYQALYGDYKTYVRKLDMFMSEVDRSKYPEVTQEYRFERVSPRVAAKYGEATTVVSPDKIKVSRGESKEMAGDNADRKSDEEETPYLIEFLDADTYTEKEQILSEHSKNMSQRDIDSIYEALSITSFSGSVPQQIEGICKYLEMQEHYEGSRLRRK